MKRKQIGKRSQGNRSATLIMVLGFCLGLAGYAGSVEPGPVSVNNGGGSVSGSGYDLSFTIGQSSAVHLSGTTHKAGVGFWYLVDVSGSLGVSEVPPVIFKSQLFQNAPNPFNPSTTIRFVVGKAGTVDLRLYDLQGREVAVLVSEDMSPGHKELTFQPRGLASGVYLYRLRTADLTATRRLTLVK